MHHTELVKMGKVEYVTFLNSFPTSPYYAVHKVSQEVAVVTNEKILRLCLYPLFAVLRMLPGSNLMLMKVISFLQKHQAQTETNLILQIKNVCALQVVKLCQL